VSCDTVSLGRSEDLVGCDTVSMGETEYLVGCVTGRDRGSCGL